jgi:hypothetical protein
VAPSTEDYIADLEHTNAHLHTTVLTAKNRIGSMGGLLLASFLLNLLLFMSPSGSSVVKSAGGHLLGPGRDVVDDVLRGERPLGDLNTHADFYTPYQNLTLKHLSWVFHDPWTKLGLNESHPTHPYTWWTEPLKELFRTKEEAERQYYSVYPAVRGVHPIDMETLDEYLEQEVLAPWKDSGLCEDPDRLFERDICAVAVSAFDKAARELKDSKMIKTWAATEDWYRGWFRGKRRAAWEKMEDLTTQVKRQGTVVAGMITSKPVKAVVGMTDAAKSGMGLG